MKNLVKPYSPLWQRINLQHAKDIFNDASELLEKIQDSDNTEDIKLLLSFLGIFVVNYSANMEKPDNITVSQAKKILFKHKLTTFLYVLLHHKCMSPN